MARQNKMFVSASCFNLFAVKHFTNKTISWAFEKPSRLSARKFKSLFLYNVNEVTKLWEALEKRHGAMPFHRPEHLLWTLYYLKVYPTWDQMALTTGITEKTLRKWVGIVVEYLANIDDWIEWENRLMRDNGSQCKITVDGTDFRIMEPSPFDPKWLSEKFNGPGVKYEVAVCIQTGWIVHTNGPYPCGQWHDLTVARDDLCYKLAQSDEDDEMALADGGYSDGYNFFETPTGHSNDDQIMKGQARARHETINRRFKMWGVMGQRFRGKPEMHEKYFSAVANLTQFLIMTCGFEPDENERQLFQIDYNDHGGTNVSTNQIPMAGDDSDGE